MAKVHTRLVRSPMHLSPRWRTTFAVLAYVCARLGSPLTRADRHTKKPRRFSTSCSRNSWNVQLSSAKKKRGTPQPATCVTETPSRCRCAVTSRCRPSAPSPCGKTQSWSLRSPPVAREQWLSEDREHPFEGLIEAV